MGPSSTARSPRSARLAAQAQNHGGSAQASAQAAAVPRAIAAELARQASRPASPSERRSKRQRVQRSQEKTEGEGSSASKLTAKAKKAKQEELRKIELQQQILRLTQELARITEQGQQGQSSDNGRDEDENDDDSDNDPNYTLFVPSDDADDLSGDLPPTTDKPTEENLSALEQLQQQRLAEQEQRARNPPPANESRHDKAAREQRQEFEELRTKLSSSRDPFAKPLRECMYFFENKAAAMELETGQRAKIMEVRSPASVLSTGSVNYTVEDIMSIAPDDSDIAAWASDAILDVKINVVNARIRQHKAYIANIAELGMFIFRDDENGYYANDGEALNQREGETGLEARTRVLIEDRNAAIDDANDPTNARANPFDPSLYPAGHMPADTTRLLLPYNISNSHWVLVEVEVDAAKTHGHVRLYNTLGSGSRRGNSYGTVQCELPGILQLIQRRPDLGWSRVRFGEIPEVKSCPQQDNSTDCGFWSIFLAEQLARSEPLTGGIINGVKKALRGKALRWEVMKDIYHHLLNKQLAGRGPLEPARAAGGSGKSSGNTKDLRGSKGSTGSGNSHSKGVRQSRHTQTPEPDGMDPEASASNSESPKTWKQFDDYRFDLRQMICDLLEEEESYYSQNGILDEILSRVQILATDHQANIAGQESVLRERVCAILERSLNSFMMLESLTPEDAAVEEIVTEGGPWYRLGPNPVHSVSTATKAAFLSTPEKAPELLDPITMEFKLTIPVVRDSGAQRHEEEFQAFRTRSKDELVSFHNVFGPRTPLPIHVQTWHDMLEHGLTGSFWTDYVFSGSSREVLFGRNSTGQSKDTGDRLRQLLGSLNAWARTQGFRQRVALLYSCTDGGTSNNDTWPEIQEEYPGIDFYVVIVQPSARCWNPAYFLVNEVDDNCWAAFEVDKLADIQRGQYIRDRQDTARFEDLPEYRFMVSANLIQYFKDDLALRSTKMDALHLEPYAQNRLAARLTGSYRKAFVLSEDTKECEVCHVVSDEHGASTLTWSRGSSTDVAVVCDNHIHAVNTERNASRNSCVQLLRELVDPFASLGIMEKGRPFACIECNERFRTKAQLDSHLNNHRKPYPCTKCPVRLGSVQSLKAHMITQHPVQEGEWHGLHECEDCDAKFEWHHQLVKHTAKHNIQCTICGLQFKDLNGRKNLTLHMRRMHPTHRPWGCKVCGKRYLQKGPLLNHLEHLHPQVDAEKQVDHREEPEEEEHSGSECDFCGALLSEFRSHDDFVAHVQQHNRMYLCTRPGCNTRMERKCDLVNHMQQHRNDLPYICTHPGCGRQFEKQQGLAGHLEIHSDERPYACTYPGCNTRVKKKSSLQRHMGSHDEKVFECTHPGCGRKFAKQQSLTAHVVVHTDERPYACAHPGCDLRFKTALLRSKHKRVHAQAKFACTICQRRFKRKDCLTRHVETHKKAGSKLGSAEQEKAREQEEEQEESEEEEDLEE